MNQVVFPNRNFKEEKFNRFFRIKKFDIEKKHVKESKEFHLEHSSNLNSSITINARIELKQKQLRELSKIWIEAVIESFDMDMITEKDSYLLILKFTSFFHKHIEREKNGLKSALISYGLPTGSIISDFQSSIANELNQVMIISLDMLKNDIENHNNQIENLNESQANSSLLPVNNIVEKSYKMKVFDEKIIWKEIKKEFKYSKSMLGKKINFISDTFKKQIIFRDIAQSYYLYKVGCYKPSVILAGGVIEELLKEFLIKHKVSPLPKDFFGYIEKCEEKGLLKKGISKLSDSVREFRNLVHLSKEQTKKHTILNTNALSAVASIFTIANDF